jgi:hypothetical protein
VGVSSEQEHDCHGDSRGGANRGHCATAVPSLRDQAGAFGLQPFCDVLLMYLAGGPGSMGGYVASESGRSRLVSINSPALK